ncbi:Sel1 repeat protein [Pseudodesulfovibrio hydrargyri]|uniref:Sel1 repeat protein n=1 Tax=Pseudodesulfovibrio hydrargyri TaxID=2125990 RepID=A0A1J5N045_9BACT|nr:tetratricopeptide repeat protein [Pseudodesulfovibrio hydrargyri]OIQ52046.1 Sel1 repeat protein [Pseudodesulfovibrio hydrargyri]
MKKDLSRYDALQFEEAFPDLKYRAIKGDGEAQFRTGVMYRFGLGVERDDAEAIHWLTAASEQGHMAARFGLAQCLQLGLDMDRSPEEGLREAARLTEECRSGDLNAYANEYLGAPVAVLQRKVVPEINLGQQALDGGKGNREEAQVHFHEAEQWLARLTHAGPPVSQNANGLLGHVYSQYFRYDLTPLYPDLYSKSERILKNRTRTIDLYQRRATPKTP